MDCPVCGTWLSGNTGGWKSESLGGGWVHHARMHVRAGKIVERISETTGNYVFYYKRSNLAVEPWRGGQTWKERESVRLRLKKPIQDDSKALAAVRKEVYRTAVTHASRRRLAVAEVDLLEYAGLIADSKADGLEEFSIIERCRNRVELFRKVAKGLRREATKERKR